MLRIMDEDGRLVDVPNAYFDIYLLSNINNEFNRAGRIIGHTLVDINFIVGDLYLNWRLKELSSVGKVMFRGELKEIRDYEVCLGNV